MPKNLCDAGTLEPLCNDHINVNVISQYGRDVGDIDDNGNHIDSDGNLQGIIKSLTSTKRDIFESICGLYHNCDLETVTGNKLDCIASLMGVTRDNCGSKYIDSDEIFRNLIKNRIRSFTDNQITMGGLKKHLDDIFGGGFDLCRDEDGCINILMTREFTAEELANIQVYMDSLPVPLSQCLKLYPADIVKCLYLQYDPLDLFQGGLNDALLNCGDLPTVYERSAWVTGDESEFYDQCFTLNAVSLNDPLNPFPTREAGLGVGAMINCDSLTSAYPKINQATLEFDQMTGTLAILDGKVSYTGLDNLSHFWRDAKGTLLGTNETFDYTVLSKSHLITYRVENENGDADQVTFHIVGKEAPVIQNVDVDYTILADADFTILSNAVDDIAVTNYQWYVDGTLVSNNKDLVRPYPAGTYTVYLEVFDDDNLADTKTWTVVALGACLTLNADPADPLHGQLNVGVLCV